MAAINETTSLQSGIQPAETTRAASNPWFWVPSLYFAQGIPYVIVMTMSVVMYKRLGISNTDIAFYTSWLYLPWVIKPFWSPLVDISGTKRRWVVAMQLLVSIGLALAASSVRGPAFLGQSLVLFGMMAFASATHDIAADGFYMLALSQHEQAWWVGLRSTFYRAAMIVGSGLLVVLAGLLEQHNGLPPVEITVQAKRSGANTSGTPGPLPNAPLNAATDSLRIIVEPVALEMPIASMNATDAEARVSHAQAWNREHGFVEADQGGEATHAEASWLSRNFVGPIGRAWTRVVTRPLRDFLQAHFPKEVTQHFPASGNIGIARIFLSGPPAARQKVVVSVEPKRRGLQNIGLAKGDNGFRLIEGERLVFNTANWDKGAMAVIELDPKIAKETSAAFVASSGNIPAGWATTLFAVAGLFVAFCCWHAIMLPRPANDRPVLSHRSLGGEFLATFGSFFQKPGVCLALAFILLYRFDEAQLVKVISPFLLDNRTAGGLGLTTTQVGLAYGTLGIVALTCGGLLGGFSAARRGFKPMLPFMVAAMYLPKLVFIFLSFTQPSNFLIVCGAIALEQLGYGFGFTAFMLYLLYFADGPHKTAHYAICTGFMALGMMVPGLWSGWLADIVGYKHFFVWVMCCALPGLSLALLVKVDPQFGKQSPAQSLK